MIEIPEFIEPEIELQNELEEVAFNNFDLKEALKTNEALFMEFFLGEELTFEIPDFHIEIFHDMINSLVPRMALAIPRGHSKTTLAKLAVVWYFLFTDYAYIIYVSNTSSIAQKAARDIAKLLSHPNFIKVFGIIEPIMWRDGDGEYQFIINQPGGKQKICILEAYGAKQQIRGTNTNNKRPELAIVDDLENDDNTASATLIIQLRNWVYGAFFKAFNRKKMKIIWLGNMLSIDSLLYHFCYKSKIWKSRVWGCLLSNGLPLWPDMWSLQDIKDDYKEYCAMPGMRARWHAEMMNNPSPPGGAIIDLDTIQYRPQLFPGDTNIGFITLDPAITKQTWSDYTAIVAHAYVDEQWQIAEIWTGKITDPLEIITRTIDMALAWDFYVIGFESVAFQAALGPLFHHILFAKNQSKIQVFPVPGGQQSKTAKIAAWAAYLSPNKFDDNKAKYTLTEGDVVITQQLQAYNPMKSNNADDVIDACSQGVHMINNYIVEIMDQVNNQNGINAYEIRGAYESCGV